MTLDSPSGNPATRSGAAKAKVTKLWIAWEDDTSIRSRILADQLGAEYHAFTFLSNSNAFAWLRYLVATLQTVGAILRTRPTLVVVQNPSVLLSSEAALFKKVWGYHLVIDLHTHFAEYSRAKQLIHDAFLGYSLRNCDTIIVTNEAYQEEIATQTSQEILVLPDKIPELRDPKPISLEGSRSVLYICTFSNDEPWREVLAAAQQLPDDTRIYVSGRSPVASNEVPPNVILTGYLPRPQYEALLHSVDVVMVLTTADKNLVCGGYEAVAAGKPLVLSDTPALRSLFKRGTVFTDNSAGSIAEAIRRAHAEAPELRNAIATLRVEMSQSWTARWEELLSLIETASAGNPAKTP